VGVRIGRYFKLVKMNNTFEIYGLLDAIREEPLLSGVTFKKIDISKYPGASREILDRFVLLKKSFQKANWRICGKILILIWVSIKYFHF
jgi:hypothetical protein